MCRIIACLSTCSLHGSQGPNWRNEASRHLSKVDIDKTQFSVMHLKIDCNRKLSLQKGRFEIYYKVLLLCSSSVLSHTRIGNLYPPLMHGHHIPKVIMDYENYLLSRKNVLICQVVVERFQDRIVPISQCKTFVIRHYIS